MKLAGRMVAYWSDEMNEKTRLKEDIITKQPKEGGLKVTFFYSLWFSWCIDRAFGVVLILMKKQRSKTICRGWKKMPFAKTTCRPRLKRNHVQIRKKQQQQQQQHSFNARQKLWWFSELLSEIWWLKCAETEKTNSKLTWDGVSLHQTLHRHSTSADQCLSPRST